jgi:hypothetical protein
MLRCLTWRFLSVKASRWHVSKRKLNSLGSNSSGRSCNGRADEDEAFDDVACEL